MLWKDLEQFGSDANEGVIALVVLFFKIIGKILLVLFFPVIFVCALWARRKRKHGK